MVKKILLILILVSAVAAISFKYWASCTMQYKVCELSCDVRNSNSDLKASACRGACVSKRVACFSKESITR